MDITGNYRNSKENKSPEALISSYDLRRKSVCRNMDRQSDTDSITKDKLKVDTGNVRGSDNVKQRSYSRCSGGNLTNSGSRSNSAESFRTDGSKHSISESMKPDRSRHSLSESLEPGRSKHSLSESLKPELSQNSLSGSMKPNRSKHSLLGPDACAKKKRSIIKIPCQEFAEMDGRSTSMSSNNRARSSTPVTNQKSATSVHDLKDSLSVSKVLRKKSPDNIHVIPFSNDDSGIVPDFDTAGPSEVKETCNKSFSYSATENKLDTTANRYRTGVDHHHDKGMVVSGVNYKTGVLADPSGGQETVHIDFRTSEEDDKILRSLRKFQEDSDMEVKKLTKELEDANNILISLQKTVYALQEEKDKSQSSLDKIKQEYRYLLEEKFTCQKQIAAIRRNIGNSHIKDRRMARELEQLSVSYERLDHQEKLMKRQIAMLEADLALVVSKLEVPKKRGKSIRSSELYKLDNNRTKSLSQVNSASSRNIPVKNRVCRKVPKEILSISTKFDDSPPHYMVPERTHHSGKDLVLPKIETKKTGNVRYVDCASGCVMKPETEKRKPLLIIEENDTQDTQLKLPGLANHTNRNIVANKGLVPKPPTHKKKGKYIQRQRALLPDIDQSKLNLSNRH